MAEIRPIKARSFRDLTVWQRSHEFALQVYRLTSAFPKTEMFALISQMRRAAVSVPANIAEGFSRRGKADKARFMNQAEASLEESRYYLILAHDLGYGDTRDLSTKLESLGELLKRYTLAILRSRDEG